MWGRTGIGSWRASWRCGGWRRWRKGRVLIDRSGGRHCYRGEATRALSGRSEPLEAAVGGVRSRTGGTLPILGLQTDSKMKVVVDRGQDEGGWIFDCRRRGDRMKDHGGGGQRSRGPRAFFYQTRENQVQRCQHTCKSNTASRPSPTIRTKWE
jgi:hypothetical protein